MKVRVSELRKAATVLLDHLEEMGYSELEISDDYYWSIPPERLYSVYEKPNEFTLGQLSSDLESIRDIGEGRQGAIAYGLVWLSSIFCYIGLKTAG